MKLSKLLVAALCLLVPSVVLQTSASAVDNDLSNNLPQGISIFLDENLDQVISTAKFFLEDVTESNVGNASKEKGNFYIRGGYEQIFFMGGGFVESEDYSSVFDIRDTDPRIGTSYAFILYVDEIPSVVFDIRTVNGETLVGTVTVSGQAASELEKAVKTVYSKDKSIYVTPLGGATYAAYAIDSDKELMAMTGVNSKGKQLLFNSSEFVNFFVKTVMEHEQEIKEYNQKHGYPEDEKIIGVSLNLLEFAPQNPLNQSYTDYVIIGAVALLGIIVGIYHVKKKKSQSKSH